MIYKLFCLLGLLSMLMQGLEASIVPVVETIPEITVTFGEEGLLTCAYERKPYAVYWKFLSDSSSINLLVFLDQYYQVGKRSGPGYDAGRYNVTNDFSLLIHDVSVKDEGRYICEVSDFETGRVFRNYTNVTVTVQAIRPLVRVHQCGNSPVSVNATDNPKASCMIKTIPDQHHVQLDCFVEGAKPQVDMFWMDNTTLQDFSNGTSLTITQGKREGTVDQKLTLIVEVSGFQSEQEYYFTCIAEGQAVSGIASVTIGITNYVPPEVSTWGIAPAKFWSLVVLLVLMLLVLISVLLWKKYKRPQRTKDGDLPMDTESGERMDNETTPLNDDPHMADNETRTPSEERIPDRPPERPLLDKRKKIKAFKPNGPTTMNEDTDYINLGVFGLTNAGRSSLINSLIFSLEGRYPGEADSTATTHRNTDSTRQIEEIELTDHIHLLNYKGMVNYDPAKPGEVFYQINGKPIMNTKVHVDCAIFICDYRNRKGQSKEFMKLLSRKVWRFFGTGIMLGIPNKGDLGDHDDKIKEEMSEASGISEDHIWIFDNYTLERDEEDVERSIGFLDFILSCLKVAKETSSLKIPRIKKNR